MNAKAAALTASSSNRRFTKIKSTSDGRIELRFQVWSGGAWDEYRMICNEQARPGFYARLEELAPFAVEIVDLPEMYGNGIRVSGVSLSYGGDEDVMGAVITAQKALTTSNGPFIFNTPHKPSEPYTPDGDDSVCLSAECVLAIEQLCEEGWKYVSGQRAQAGLFDAAGETAPAESRPAKKSKAGLNVTLIPGGGTLESMKGAI